MKNYITKIQERRKQTPWDEYVMNLMSWVPMNFYKNDGHISRYPDTPRSPKIVSNSEFETLRDSLLDYGREYDNSRGFFEQFGDLYQTTPTSATIQQMAGENSDYADMVVESRQTYLSNIVCGGSEHVYYSFSVVLASRNIFSSVRIRRSENVYYSVGVDNSQNIFYSKYIKDSNNIYLSANLIGCHDCILCEGLQNKSYCIKNKQYSKEEYEIKKLELLANKNIFEEFYSKINSKPKNIDATHCEGTLLVGCENTTNAISVNYMKQGNNVMFGGEGENYYDCFDFGVESGDFYGVVSVGTGSSHVYCSNLIEACSNIFYSSNCNNSHHLFGCIGLQNKSYFILNKQYSKADWEQKVIEIMADMEQQGILGEFFPSLLNPLYFNHSMAAMMDDFSESEIISAGFLYENTMAQSSQGENIVGVSEIEKYYNFDGKISTDILDVTLQDEAGMQYSIIQAELDFLNKYSLPIPTTHWLTRMREHIGNIKK